MGDLADAMKAYAAGGLYPMHMPGHKRDVRFGLGEPMALDLTEVDGVDDLYAAGGILAEGMARAATLYGSRAALYLVGGSTAGVLAGVLAAAPAGSAVAIARNSHRSAYAALELGRLSPVYLLPAQDMSFGVAGSIAPADVAAALDRRPDIKLVLITSPTYDGVVSDVAAIARVAHGRGVPLMVDAAHGAHLGFSAAFPESAVAAGADLAVMSLHKTLPALTQCALLHVSGALVDEDEVRRRLSMVQTSSPSYPLMASIDQCVGWMAREGAEAMAAHGARLDRFSAAAADLKRLRVMRMGRDAAAAHPGVFGFDRSKLVISTRGTDLTGPALAAALREQHAIETEMALGDYVLALTGPCDSDEGMARLEGALLAIDRAARPGKQMPPAPTMAMPVQAMPVQAMPIADAMAAAREETPLSAAAGRVAAEYAWAYPPGVPLIAPGERVGGDFVAAAAAMAAAGVALRRTSGGRAGCLRVVARQ
ncbi:MAG: aminotransferase class V-fold PLP-dependent enzyme [Clostridiales bacterium]|nr:aminotransferase class V-fold PLP-dependent enzyme [Clostridiales bacterium]